MTVLTTLLQVVALVVVVGGIAKLVRPHPFAALLGSLGVPGGAATARAAGMVEVALGAAAVVTGARWAAALLAAAYVVFALTVVVAQRRGAVSCGCFGVVDAPPSTLHVVVNLVSAGVAAAAAAVGSEPLRATLAEQPAAGLPYLAAVGVAVYFVVRLDVRRP
ncbi:MAG: MauE/DoxX family redox-associated membrane protein [Actinomycetes bacterium]